MIKSLPKKILSPLIIFLFLLLGFLIYSNTFNVPFVLDDGMNIERNYHIRMRTLNLESIANVFRGKVLWNRPLLKLSFAINYYFGRYSLPGFHGVNILLHVITGSLFFLFLYTTLKLNNKNSHDSLSLPKLNPIFISFFAVLIWFVHPLCTQSVTYISQRMNSLVSLFYILSLWLYTQGRMVQEKQSRTSSKAAKGARRKILKSPYIWFTASALSGICALLSKEIAATLPFIIYEWYFFQNVSREWLRQKIKWIMGAVIIFAGFGVINLLVIANPIEKINKIYSTLDYTLMQAYLTEFRVIIYYLGLIFFPHPSRLNIDYDFSYSISLIDPLTTLLSLGLILGLIGAGIYLAKRDPLFTRAVNPTQVSFSEKGISFLHDGKLLSFCIFWYFGNFAVEFLAIPLFSPQEIIFDHRTYLPSMLVSLLVVIVIWRISQQNRMAALLFCTIALVFSVWTYQRNIVYQDPDLLWAQSAERSKNNSRPYHNLGASYAEKGQLDKAMQQYSKALGIDPDAADTLDHMGQVLIQKGKPDEAIKYFTRALSNMPQYVEAHIHLGNTLAGQGQIQEALDHFNMAISINPGYAQTYSQLANVLASQGQINEAFWHYERALQIDPEDANTHYNFGNTLQSRGQIGLAQEHYYKALKINPEDIDSRNNLAVTMMQLGKFQQAVSEFEKILKINPRADQSRKGLEMALEMLKQEALK